MLLRVVAVLAVLQLCAAQCNVGNSVTVAGQTRSFTSCKDFSNFGIGVPTALYWRNVGTSDIELLLSVDLNGVAASDTYVALGLASGSNLVMAGARAFIGYLMGTTNMTRIQTLANHNIGTQQTNLVNAATGPVKQFYLTVSGGVFYLTVVGTRASIAPQALSTNFPILISRGSTTPNTNPIAYHDAHSADYYDLVTVPTTTSSSSSRTTVTSSVPSTSSTSTPTPNTPTSSAVVVNFPSGARSFTSGFEYTLDGLPVNVYSNFNSNTQYVELVAVAPITAGRYLAFALSQDGEMLNSEAWFGSVSSFMAYKLGDGSLGNPINLNAYAATEAFYNGTHQLVRVVRPWAFAQNSLQITPDTPAIILIATGPMSGSVPAKHSSKTSVQVSDWNSGTIQVSEGNYKTKIKAHAGLMVAAWGFLVPIAIISARYLKHHDPLWFNIHRIANTVAVLAIVVSAIIGLATGSHFYRTHMGIGLTAVILAFLQPLNALARPDKQASSRKAWNNLHWWSGRIAIVLGWANVFVGIDIYQAPVVTTILFAVLIGIVTVCPIIYEMTFGERHKTERVPSSAEFN
eukprot:Colp12_sorted_trinity150504_noHs@7230